MTNLNSVLKCRDITLATKVRLFRAMVFPIVMYGCESWTIKKTECWRIDAFDLWCWRRLFRVPWIARRSNQSILKEISPEDSLEGVMLKLKLQYFGHLMLRTDLLEKTLILGKMEGRRRRGQQRMRWLDDITELMDMSLSMLVLGVGNGQGSLACCSAWGHKELDTTGLTDQEGLKGEGGAFQFFYHCRVLPLSPSTLHTTWLPNTYSSWVPICIKFHSSWVYQTQACPLGAHIPTA